MKYELKNQIYSINDALSTNILVVGFATKISGNQILENLKKIKEFNPILSSQLVESNGNYYFDTDNGNFEYKIDNCDNVNTWISTQLKNPLDLFNGEFIRLAINNENTLIIMGHAIISDSRGLVNFAKALLQNPQQFDFSYNQDINKKLNFLNAIKANEFKRLKTSNQIELNNSKIKVKKISLKSKLVYSLCAGAGVSTLSFFLTVALSLNKTSRKSIQIPFCIKDNENDILINDTYNIKFKRGMEPRLSFYDNAGEIDKLFKSILKRKPYLSRNEIIKSVPNELKPFPTKNEKYLNYIKSEMFFDVLPSIDDDKLIRTLQYYPSSSFVTNGFGISIVDDTITICSIIHDDDGENFFKDYQKTINLISKNADLAFK